MDEPRKVDGLTAEAYAAFRQRDWVRAHSLLAEVCADGDASGDEWYMLGESAWWLGKVDEALAALERAYGRYVEEGKPAEAAKAGLPVSFTLAMRGELGSGSGWLRRVQRLLAHEPLCSQHGYLLYTEVDWDGGWDHGDPGATIEAARRIQEIGEELGDATVNALGTLAEGKVLVRTGQVRDGIALLDEAMLAALEQDIEPAWAGDIYCNLMGTCHTLGDLQRAAEWTRAAEQWCAEMPGAGPFLGICRVYRVELHQLQGSWDLAEREARRVCEELGDFHVQPVAEAHYQLGELERLRGNFAAARRAYGDAHRLGRDPQPGRALVQLAEGDADGAWAAIEAALTAAPGNELTRVPLYRAQAEVALAAGWLESAGEASAALDDIAARYGTSGLDATATSTRAALLLARDGARAALPELRRACSRWQELQAPYECARMRLALADAYAAMGNEAGARFERETAEEMLGKLGVGTASSRGGVVTTRPQGPDGLSAREREVLQLAAEGLSNKGIAEHLVLSVRTVERHLATAYEKLGFRGRGARAAAIAYVLRTKAENRAQDT